MKYDDIEIVFSLSNLSNIRHITYRCRDYEFLQSFIAQATEEIDKLKPIKNREAKLLNTYLKLYISDAKKRYNKLKLSQSRKAREQEIVRLRKQHAKDKIDSLVAEQVFKFSIKQNRIKNAFNAREMLLKVEDSVIETGIKEAQEIQENNKMKEIVSGFIKQGFSPSEALQKYSHGEFPSEETSLEDLV